MYLSFFKLNNVLVKEIINKKYILYGISIIFTRGLELLVLFFAAHYLSKEDYGSLEFYKKTIEVGSSFVAFGFPALLMTYTRSDNSKKYFYFIAILYILFLSFMLWPVLFFFHLEILIVPLFFYAVFFTGGLTQMFLLIKWDSFKVSYYKIFISFLFYGLVYILIRYFKITTYAFVYPAYFLFPFFISGLVYLYYQQDIIWRQLKQYRKLFHQLLSSSFTLVVSNFANLMFLYTDIFILKLIGDKPNIQIANYSFSLNIANILLLVPVTLVQVDIEKLKKSIREIKVLEKKILTLTFLLLVILFFFYKVLINYIFVRYVDTFLLFIIILLAKFFQALTPLYGTYLAIQRRYILNLIINLFVLVLNVLLSYFLYFQWGVYGVAIASVISLFVRFNLFKFAFKKVLLLK